MSSPSPPPSLRHSRHLDGAIDDVRMYRGHLRLAEIEELARARR